MSLEQSHKCIELPLNFNFYLTFPLKVYYIGFSIKRKVQTPFKSLLFDSLGVCGGVFMYLLAEIQPSAYILSLFCCFRLCWHYQVTSLSPSPLLYSMLSFSVS